ncbi:MAG TPA: VTT domain-containing protein [Thermoanaerobaculia bacterium]|nr:VTT domain-containing protein [Thermoanaerobaculia bacterium]
MPTLPRGLVLRFALFAALLAAAFLVISSKTVRDQLEIETLTATLERVREEPLAAPLYIAATALLAAAGFPASVLVLAGGAVFGALFGGVLAYLGTLAAALLSFALARTLAHGLVVHLLGPRLAPLDALLEQHGFWALFRLRYVPVPFALTNYGAALAGLPFATYAWSTAAALVPVTFLYTYFAASLVEVAAAERAGVLRNLLLAGLAVLALSFLPTRISAWRRRKARTRPAAPAPPPADR